MAYTGSKAQSGKGSSLGIGATITVTGTTTTGSTSVTSVSSITGITVGMPITGTGIASGTTVAAVASGTITLSQNATASGTAVSLTVGPQQIGEVRSVPFKRGPWTFADTTNFQSGADKETLPIIRDNGSITLSGNRVSGDTGQAAVEAAYQSGAIQTFTLTLPKTSSQTTIGDTYSFNAYVKSSDFNADAEKEVDFSIDLMISGPTTLTLGS